MELVESLMSKKLCPICKKNAVAEHMPFCSARCKTIDLGAWADESYRIPIPEDQSEEDV